MMQPDILPPANRLRKQQMYRFPRKTIMPVRTAVLAPPAA
jgi:hypothetical protein